MEVSVGMSENSINLLGIEIEELTEEVKENITKYIGKTPEVCDNLVSASANSDMIEFIRNLDKVYKLLKGIQAWQLCKEVESLKKEWFINQGVCARNIPQFVMKVQTLSIELQLLQFRGYCLSPKVLYSDDFCRTPKILTVDDRPEILTAITGILSSAYQVFAVTNGESALKLMGKHEIDLFILDIDMPIMDGFELAEKIRLQEKYQKTPILFLTTNAYPDYVKRAWACGANDFAVKPVNRDVLLNKIDQYL